MNLLEGITAEIKRCKELEQAYEDVGQPGLFALTMLCKDIAEAEAARDSGDVMRMIPALKELQECQ